MKRDKTCLITVCTKTTYIGLAPSAAVVFQYRYAIVPFYFLAGKLLMTFFLTLLNMPVIPNLRLKHDPNQGN
jgi:hypothetical protein